MAVLRICLAVSVVAILLKQGESTLLCGMEIEYSGFNPIEALQLIQVRQIQEFEKLRSILSQLKFELKSEDYSAWKRCLKEFRKEKLRYIKEVARMKASFAELVQALVTRKLDPAQYQIELQKLFQQFQTQFTPAVEMFKSKIQYLFDTIRDENRRKEWWSTVKTTQVKTENGQTTRTSLTQMDSGIGGQRTQSITKQSQSVSNAVLGGSSSFKQSKLGGYGGSSNGGYDSSSQQSNSGYDASEQSSGDENEQYGGQSSGNSYNAESESQKRSGIEYSSQQSGDYSSSNDQLNQQSSSGYNSDNQQNGGYGSSNSEYNSETQQSSGGYGSSSQQSSGSGGYGSSSQQSSGGYGSSSQQSGSGYSASQKSSGYETQQRSGYGAVSKTKEVKQESATVTGSTVDNSGINFSNTQTRSGLKETYGTAKESYSSSSSGGYGRKRRGLGLAGAAVETATNVAGNAVEQGSRPVGTVRRRRTLGLLLGAGLATAAAGGAAMAGAGIAKSMLHSKSEGYSDGYQSGSGGSQYGSSGFQSSSGGSRMKSGEFQASSGSFEQRSNGFQGVSGGYPGYSNGFNKESTRNSVSQFESGMEGLSKYGSPSQLGSSGYESLGQKSISGYSAKSQQSGGYQSQQRSGLGVISKTKEVKEESTIIGNGGGSGYGSGYDSNEQSSGYESQQRSGYGAVSKTKEVKEESAYIGKTSGTGSFSDNSDINFSNTQTRSGMKDTYGGYGRKRRNLGLVNVAVEGAANVAGKDVL